MDLEQHFQSLIIYFGNWVPSLVTEKLLVMVSYASLQVCNYARIQEYLHYTCKQVCKYARLQVCKYACIHVCKYVGIQEGKIANMYVSLYALIKI